MELVELGGSGLRVSRVGLGCNNFGGRLDLAATRAVVDAALDVGVTFFDTAETYGGGGGSERFLGEILEGRRDRVVLATKFGWGSETGDGSAAAVHKAIEGSLQRLRPITSTSTTSTRRIPRLRSRRRSPLSTRSSGRRQGTRDRLLELLRGAPAEADRVARESRHARFTVLQNHYSPLERRDDSEVLPALSRARRLVHPVLPARKRAADQEVLGEASPPRKNAAGRARDRGGASIGLEALAAATERRHTLHELAISALASTPGIGSVIAGATKAEQVRANAAAASWRLSAEALDALARL